MSEIKTLTYEQFRRLRSIVLAAEDQEAERRYNVNGPQGADFHAALSHNAEGGDRRDFHATRVHMARAARRPESLGNTTIVQGVTHDIEWAHKNLSPVLSYLDFNESPYSVY